MSSHHNADLTRTLQELAPRSVETWVKFAAAGTWVIIGTAVMLLLMLLFLVIL